MMKDLRDWYSFLEEVARRAASPDGSPGKSERPKVFRIPPAEEILASQAASALRRPGRRPLTETREQIIQRVLDPELTLHEAAALLDLSKATVRRYTGLGKLRCLRTAGGQRRFKLSDLLSFLEAGDRRSRSRTPHKLETAR